MKNGKTVKTRKLVIPSGSIILSEIIVRQKAETEIDRKENYIMDYKRGHSPIFGYQNLYYIIAFMKENTVACNRLKHADINRGRQDSQNRKAIDALHTIAKKQRSRINAVYS